MTDFYIVATPIGNLADITYRAVETLQSAELIICENPANSRGLLMKYGIKAPTTSYNDKSDATTRLKLIDRISRLSCVCLISDAGTPLVSDPGFKLMRDLVVQGSINIIALPGASAALAALMVAGLPNNKFFFQGFLSHKPSVMLQEIEHLKNIKATSIIFESPLRVVATLQALQQALGDVQIAVSKELTKIYETTWRGSISHVLAQITEDKLRGEFVIVVEPVMQVAADLAAVIDKYYQIKEASLKDLAVLMADETGYSKHNLYEGLLRKAGKKS